MSMKSSPRPADDELDRLVGLGITRQQVEPGDDCLDCVDPEVLAAYADGGLSAEERAAVEVHLASCRDCRHALALQVQSDPLGASASASVRMSADGEAAAAAASAASTEAAPAAMGPPTSGYAASGHVVSGPSGTRGGSRGVAGRPGIIKLASTWLPLAAALFVAAGLWGAFKLSRQGAPDAASAPAHVNARNEPSAAPQAAAPAEAARSSAPNAGSSAAPSSTDRALTAAEGEAEKPRELMRKSTPAGAAAPSDKPSPSRPDADGRAGQASALTARVRGTYRDEAAAASRPNAAAEADRRPAPAAAPVQAPPPPPAPAVLADAAAARVGVTAGQPAGKEAQAKAAGQLGQATPLPGAPPAASAPAVAANQAAAPQQAGQQNAINQTQQNAITQQTGPMANLNIMPPPAKTDERRQTESQRAANDAKREVAAPPAEEPKSVARAKAAPESNAAPAAAAPRPSTETEGRDTAFRTGVVGGVGAGAAPGARADDTKAGVINEAITVVTSSPPATGPVLQSADGARWWRIRAPSTIESSVDRGASWTVEYSDPSARLVRGAAAAKSGCWMIGANGLVLRTRPDGGWERVTQPTTRGLVTLTATDHLIATVTDDQGRAWRTTDGGATWR